MVVKLETSDVQLGLLDIQLILAFLNLILFNLHLSLNNGKVLDEPVMFILLLYQRVVLILHGILGVVDKFDLTVNPRLGLLLLYDELLLFNSNRFFLCLETLLSLIKSPLLNRRLGAHGEHLIQLGFENDCHPVVITFELVSFILVLPLSQLGRCEQFPHRRSPRGLCDRLVD